ncbi:MarR family winged helix-turn-helix transcriptional regulator [Nocardioides sp. GXZ039]|uniref:MarR family winged helix-turn-helix transcriptional regulator n=1 Tax=Nocardioides sp. GXZ039 TaxID=3136018 RepID=UPI0030F406DD
MNDHTDPASDAPVPLDAQLCFSIYSASIAVQRLYKPLLDELGITYTQYLVLSTLWEDDGPGISAIAQRLALEPSTITPAVKRLEAAGLVTRRRSETDERQVVVELTPEGSALYPRTAELTRTLLRCSGLDVPGLAGLTAQMQTLTAHLREPAAESEGS